MRSRFNKFREKYFKKQIIIITILMLALTGGVTYGIVYAVQKGNEKSHAQAAAPTSGTPIAPGHAPPCNYRAMPGTCVNQQTPKAEDKSESDLYKTITDNPSSIQQLVFLPNGIVALQEKGTDDEAGKIYKIDVGDQQDVRRLALTKHVPFGTNTRSGDRLESELYNTLSQEADKIKELTFNKDSVSVVPHMGNSYSVNTNGDVDQQDLRKLAIEKGVDFSSHNDKNSGIAALRWVGIALLILIVIFAIATMRKNRTRPPGATGNGRIGRTGATGRTGRGGRNAAAAAQAAAETPTKQVKFSDVIGQKDAIKHLKRFGAMLLHPELLEEHDATMPGGILLYGPPGEGKTLLAQATACELGLPFFYASASDLMEQFVGIGAQRVRALWNQAKAVDGPAVIFLDEIDAVGGKREGSNSDERKQTLNAILTEMQGFREHPHPILVIAATNIPDSLDRALLRPGRFDAKIAVARPTLENRIDLFKLYTRNKCTDDLDFAELAHKAAGLSAAQIANICNESALGVVNKIIKLLTAGQAGKEKITQEHMLDSIKQEIKQQPKDSIGKRFQSDNLVTRENYIGQDEAWDEAESIVAYLQDPEFFHRNGLRAPKGVIFSGSPGNGKTLLARAIAGEAGVPFFSVSGSEFVDHWVGQGASNVRDLFAEAKQNAPCVLFIDEIDAVASKRSGQDDGGSKEQNQTVNQLLTEMDGLEQNDKPIIVLAATNRQEMLDPAVKRRFDGIVDLEHPATKDRLALFQLYTRSLKLAADVDLKDIARNTSGLSAADIESVCNASGNLQRRINKKNGQPMADIVIKQSTLDEAILRKSWGTPSGKIMSYEDKLNTAVHEGGGHAAIAQVLGQEMARITIMARGQAGGHVQYMNDDIMYMNKETMLDRITGALGGYVAQELILGITDTGLSSDIQQASKMARAMIVDYGWTELGFIPQIEGVAMSEEQTAKIEAKSQEILQACDVRARQIITDNRARIDLIVETLMEQETLLGTEYAELWNSIDISTSDDADEPVDEAPEPEIVEDAPRNNNVIDAAKEFRNPERPRGLRGKLRKIASVVPGLKSAENN